MRRLACCLVLPLVLLLGACTESNAPSTPSTQQASEAQATSPTPLLLISIDAFRADYLGRGGSPTMAKLAKHGVHAKAMQPSFPSLTFPNHYTLVTGLYPDHHGIVNNNMYDPKLGKFSLGNRAAVTNGKWWDEGEPIWVTADKQGLTTATMFWPGSGAEIHGHRPDYWRPFDDSVTATQRVDQVLQWLDLPKAERPDFITLYFDAVDHAGHRYGPDSPQVDKAITHVDNAIARLVKGLKARQLFHHMNIIIVSDHGMAKSPKGQYIRMDKLINLDHVRVVSMGEVAGFNPKPEYAKSVTAKLTAPHPHMTCWRPNDIPERFHYGTNPRVPAITCLADVGWQITSSQHLAHSKYPMSLGSHGYDNANVHMRALFIAHGPAFKQGLTVPEFPNVDVYPLMTHVLGIKAQPNDGSYEAVEDMLKPAKR